MTSYLWDITLAGAYLTGNGVPKDAVQAAKWMQLAAAHGDAETECNLAILYQKGTGLPQSYEDARAWFQMAAEQGFVTSSTISVRCMGTGKEQPRTLWKPTSGFR